MSEETKPPDDIWNRKRIAPEKEHDPEGALLILMLFMALMLAGLLVTAPPREVCDGKPVVAHTLSPETHVPGVRSRYHVSP